MSSSRPCPAHAAHQGVSRLPRPPHPPSLASPRPAVQKPTPQGSGDSWHCRSSLSPTPPGHEVSHHMCLGHGRISSTYLKASQEGTYCVDSECKREKKGRGEGAGAREAQEKFAFANYPFGIDCSLGHSFLSLQVCRAQLITEPRRNLYPLQSLRGKDVTPWTATRAPEVGGRP